MLKPTGGGPQPSLSVVVCSYTAARLTDIRHLLSALQQQSYAHLETVFVADSSAELQRAVAQHVRKRGFERVRVVLNGGRPGLAAARNVGVAHAEGEIIAFIDDDALPFADWGERIAAALTRDDAAGVTGPAFPLWEDESLAWLPEEFYWLVSCPTPGWLGWSDVREVRNAWGMNMAFRRDAFRVCRFPEEYGYRRAPAARGASHLLGEDTAFSVELRRRTGKAILFDPTVRVYHRVNRQRLSPSSIRRRAFWEGYTKARLRERSQGTWEGIELSPEREQLRRLAVSFLPAAIIGLIRQPRQSWRRLLLAADAVGHVGLGYAAGSIPALGPLLCRRYAE